MDDKAIDEKFYRILEQIIERLEKEIDDKKQELKKPLSDIEKRITNLELAKLQSDYYHLRLATLLRTLKHEK